MMKYALLAVLISITMACNMDSFVADSWEITIENAGSSSSPKAADLNGDGIKDIVIGSGGPEFKTTPHGVLAIDGSNGDILWQVDARNQIVGTPLLVDFNDDMANDVLIGGRSGELSLINGSSGQEIWKYMPDDDNYDLVNDTLILNFFNPQLCPDLDGDEQLDIIIAYGGFVKAKPEDTDRPQGYLMAVSSATGKELIKMPAPDGRELYCSPIIADINKDGSLDIFFGSGGETIGGSFYRLPFDDFAQGKYDAAIALLTDSLKGFIAPPTLVDINNDSYLDIVVNSVNGKVTCLNGLNMEPLWEAKVGDNFEGYAMSCPGLFYGDDDIKDIFTTYGYGAWPNTEYTTNILIDGKDGSIVYRDSAGTFQYASPVSYDFTSDGYEDVLMAINSPITTTLKNTSAPVTFLGNDLKIYDLREHKVSLLRSSRVGSNIGSTPLITDLDGDGYLDIVSCYMTDARNFYSFSKMAIERIEIQTKKVDSFNWNSYMGINTDGIDYPIEE